MIGSLYKELRHYAVPLLLLMVVLVLVGMVAVLKNQPGSRTLSSRLEEVSAAAASGDWAQIDQTARQLEVDWRATRPWLILTTSNRYLESFDGELASLGGAVAGQDLAMVQVTQRRLSYLWSVIGG